MGRKIVQHILGVMFAVLVASMGSLTLATSQAHAVQSVPYQMNFQGRLNNASGAPMAAGTYNMIFRIYNVATGGSALWTETRAVSASQGVTITSGGLFSVQLGSVTSLPSTIFNSTSPLYLEVELPSPATATSTSPSWTEGAMGPRNPIVSSPYAINSDLLDGLDSSAFAAASGSTGYIQNQGASPQAANFNISGTGTATSLQAASLDTSSAGTLALGNANATSITLGANTTVGAGKSLTLSGGITSTRPASPTKGMLYYDTSKNQLLQYNGTKWVGSQKTAAIVAASDSSQTQKDAADFVATGTNDQTTIASAISSLGASGGTVYLLPGDYYFGASLAVTQGSVTITGGQMGAATIRRQFDGSSLVNGSLIYIDSSSVKVTDLTLDGASSTYTNTYNNGIYKDVLQSAVTLDTLQVINSGGSGIFLGGDANMGSWGNTVNNTIVDTAGVDGISGHYASSTAITNNKVSGITGTGISFGDSAVTISNNTVGYSHGSQVGGAGISSGGNGTVTGNTVQNIAGVGIYASSGDVITGNQIGSNGYGIDTGGGGIWDATISGNTVGGNTYTGIHMNGGSPGGHVLITGNTIASNGQQGIYVQDSYTGNVISNNNLDGNATTGSYSAIQIGSSTATSISNNTITGGGSSGYAISNGGDGSIISGNTFSGTGATAIQDTGTGTVWSNQAQSSAGSFLTRSSSDSTTAFQIQNASGASALNVDTSNSLTTVNGGAVLQSNVASSSPTPTIVGSGATSSATATSRTVSTNSSTQTGDLVILVGYMEPANEGSPSATYGTITTPVGVTLASGFPINTDDGFITSADTHRLYVWYYYATANGTQSLNFTDTQSVYWGITATTIRGGPTSGNPFADTPSTNTVSSSATGNTSTPNVSLALAGSNNLVLWAFGDWNGGLPGTPSGYTGVTSSTNNAGQPGVASKVYSTSGSTGTIAASVSGNDHGMTAALLSIRGATTSTQPLSVKSTSGAQIFSISGTGSVLSKNSFDSTAAFQIQNAAGVTALNVDTTTNTITLGSGSNTVTFTAGGGLIASGTARHTKTILLTPEYAGAVLDAASDASCSSANSGTMTSGLDNTNRMNYYNWTSSSASAQCYDVVVQVPIPADFNGWASVPDIRLSKDSTGTASYAINIIDSTGTVDTNYNYSAPGTLGTSWANMATSAFGNTAGTNGTTSYAPGGYFTIKVRVSSTSSANVKLGNIKLTYSSTF